MTAPETRLYTVCGLRVDSDPPEQWGGVCGTTEAVDADGAISFVDLDVRGDVSDDRRVTCLGLALACVHLGDIDVVGPLNRATMDLTVEEVRRERARCLDLAPQEWTVCGVDRRTFAGLCYHVTAASWLLAYVEAYDLAGVDGCDLLYARTHPGHVARIVGYPYADPLATSEAAMRLRLDEWGVR